jgi:hypothetical protein
MKVGDLVIRSYSNEIQINKIGIIVSVNRSIATHEWVTIMNWKGNICGYWECELEVIND